MKKQNLFYILSSVLCTSISFISYAAPGSTSGSGVVKFTGEILDAPCSIAPESADQTINMGQISNRELELGGKSQAHPFSIKLENCAIGINAGPKEDRKWIPTSGSATFTFSGGSSHTNSSFWGGLFGKRLFAVTGSAKGVGLSLESPSGEHITNNSSFDPIKIQQGDNTITFNSYIQAIDKKKGSVTPGDFQSVINFTINYS
ncbi:fimbrial protein [Photobacterium damselae]|uniref:fimbrial protein n=1 Tax=Photobacterium damselae TaxID=38293 RepID=UPI0014445B01|nr:fimbrial protein [Photobacterium damselae]